MPSPFYTLSPRGLLRSLLGTSNIADIDAGFLALATDVELKMLNYSSGLASAMGAAGTDGRLYRQTDTGKVFLDTGSALVPVMIPTPWTALTALTGWTAAASPNDPAARLEGDVVRLKGSIRNTSGGALAVSNLASLPAFAALPTNVSRAMSVNTTVSFPGGALGGPIGIQVSGSPATSGIWINSSSSVASGVYVQLDGCTYTLT